MTEHIPVSTDLSGQLDTSGTSAGGHSRLENIAAVFDVARARDLQVALRALDPEDREVHEDQVQVSQGITVTHGDPEAEKARVVAEAERAQQRVEGQGAASVSAEPSEEAQASSEGSGTPGQSVEVPAPSTQNGIDPALDGAASPALDPNVPKQPNKAGPGSSRDEWILYAKAVDPTLTDERAQSMTRTDLINAYGV